jgi:hypothetical protein
MVAVGWTRPHLDRQMLFPFSSWTYIQNNKLSGGGDRNSLVRITARIILSPMVPALTAFPCVCATNKVPCIFTARQARNAAAIWRWSISINRTGMRQLPCGSQKSYNGHLLLAGVCNLDTDPYPYARVEACGLCGSIFKMPLTCTFLVLLR